ncbi:related to TNA1 - high affinity nicotinic acid plasma membrane permease [Pseudozyma flocculosa]|uniref:Related to TNA1 - high affinity nicotinic acid plasma membrane permease n=1 Tax=Pseudozyma flocculosa TaxID=84751 RepID=A0A5C3ESU3_9BASI|nr:related to TNA1 - high affinity nicotinic acid plasma membrane permease [Pseudozyma flocculosa]
MADHDRSSSPASGSPRDSKAFNDVVTPPHLESPERTAHIAAVEKRLKRKMDLQLVPLCLMIYLLSFLDRTNIGQARLNGLEKDLNMSKDGKDYRIALTVLYVPYILFEIPSNLVLKKIGPSIWIPSLLVAWGLVSTLQGIVHDKTGLYINRAFLGFTEAGVLPALALYLTFFYKPHELNLRQALYFSGASLSAFWMLPNDITKLWWVTPEEAELARTRMLPAPEKPVEGGLEAAGDKVADRDVLGATRATAVVDQQEKHEVTGSYVLSEVKRTLLDPLVLLFAASGYAYATLLYSAAFFSPTIIKAMDKYTVIQSQLLSCPPTAAAFIVSVAVAFASDRYKWRYPFAVGCIILAIIGTSVAYTAIDPKIRYGGLIILTCGTYSIPPIGISWMLNNTASHYKRATSIALYIVFTNCGGITSTWLFNNNEAPRFERGFLVNLCLCCAAIVLVTVAELLMVMETKKRKAGKRDHRVTELQAKGWSDAHIKDYLGDRHPQFEYTL